DAYARVLGHAATHDAYHHVRPAPDGRQLARAMSEAVARSGLQPADIDAVFADGAGDRHADAIEVAAIRAVFGDRADRIPVPAPTHSTKPSTMVGVREPCQPIHRSRGVTSADSVIGAAAGSAAPPRAAGTGAPAATATCRLTNLLIRTFTSSDMRASEMLHSS